jgi:hypothetical protein
MTGVCHHAQQLVEKGVWLTFAWADLEPQSYQVVRITGMSLCAPLNEEFFVVLLLIQIKQI